MLRYSLPPLLLLTTALQAQPIVIPSTNPAVRAALATIRTDNAWTLEQQASICEIAAPPFKEALRAAEFKRRLDYSAVPRAARRL